MQYSKEKMRTYMQEYRRRKQSSAITALGGKCVKCASVENLEFDHIDPATKLFTISGWFKSNELMLAELKKCQLLCHSCHQEKSAKECSDAMTGVLKAPEHGSLSGYISRRCRCNPCKRAYKEWALSRRERLKMGR